MTSPRNTTEAGYGGRWPRYAKAFRREHPLCLPCQLVGIVQASQCVDHIVPHRGNDALRMDPRNWQALCHHHHSRKTRRESAGMVICWAPNPRHVVISNSDRMDTRHAVRLFHDVDLEFVTGDPAAGFRRARACGAVWHVLEVPEVQSHTSALRDVLGESGASGAVLQGGHVRRTV